MSNYSLEGLINLSSAEVSVIKKKPLVKKEQWNDKLYDPIKQRLKKELIIRQFDRCAYCRRIVEPNAYYEPLEHIVPKSIYPQWMFEPKNLIVTCNTCNNLKGNDDTLVASYKSSIKFPLLSKAFLIFNPHFDKWHEHLRYEDEIFLVAVPNSKGKDTIRICKLYRFHVIVNKAKELKMKQKEPMRKIVSRLSILEKKSKEGKEIIKELYDAINFYIDRVDDNDNF